MLAHEALHDYSPYFGHDHINAREKRLQELSDLVKAAGKEMTLYRTTIAIHRGSP